jgi:DNA-binding MarR family transcriptional regulator
MEDRTESFKSVFDPRTQHDDVDSKIVAALERLSQAFRSLLWEEVKQHELSPIQGQFLVYLLYHPPELCRVSQLAREFGLTQATVSDAVAALESKGLLYREPWQTDRRVSTLRLTVDGAQMAARLSTWADAVRVNLEHFSPEQKEAVMHFLMRLIESLQRAGIVTVARMCITCRFFQAGGSVHTADAGGADNSPTAAPYYCRLLQKPLFVKDLRISCHEHSPADDWQRLAR